MLDVVVSPLLLPRAPRYQREALRAAAQQRELGPGGRIILPPSQPMRCETQRRRDEDAAVGRTEQKNHYRRRTDRMDYHTMRKTLARKNKQKESNHYVFTHQLQCGTGSAVLSVAELVRG